MIDIKIRYKDLENITDRTIPIVQTYCKELVRRGLKGRLLIYPNTPTEDDLPDVIYNIQNAANNANCRFQTKGIDFNKEIQKTATG